MPLPSYKENTPENHLAYRIARGEEVGTRTFFSTYWHVVSAIVEMIGRGELDYHCDTARKTLQVFPTPDIPDDRARFQAIFDQVLEFLKLEPADLALPTSEGDEDPMIIYQLDGIYFRVRDGIYEALEPLRARLSQNIAFSLWRGQGEVFVGEAICRARELGETLVTDEGLRAIPEEIILNICRLTGYWSTLSPTEQNKIALTREQFNQIIRELYEFWYLDREKSGAQYWANQVCAKIFALVRVEHEQVLAMRRYINW